MKNKLLAMQRPGRDLSVDLVSATVIDRADSWFVVDFSDTTTARVLRAASCLIEPACGDTVLLCQGRASRANPVSYILAVLARNEAAGASLRLPGGVTLNTECGNLQVHAERVALNVSDSIALQAPAITMAGLSGDLQFHRMTASIQNLRACCGVVNTMAQNVTSTVVRLLQKTRDSFRWTENLDETRAGRMCLQVTERFQLQARHAAVIAEGQIKVDGQKIDIG